MYRRSKPHACLSLAQRSEAFAALRFAKHIGRTLNVAFTIHWALAGGTGTWRERQNRIVDLLRRWLGHHGGRSIPYIWTAEQSPNGKDVHTHAIIHLPAHLSLLQLDRYLRMLLQCDDPLVLKVDLCANHPRGASGWIEYMCKAMGPEHIHLVPVGMRQGQGTVIGPRFGVAHCIRRAAREEHYGRNDALPKKLRGASVGLGIVWNSALPTSRPAEFLEQYARIGTSRPNIYIDGQAQELNEINETDLG